MNRRTLLVSVGSIGVASTAGCQQLPGNTCGEETSLYVHAEDPESMSATADGGEEIPELRESELSAEELEIFEKAMSGAGYTECGERSAAFDGLLAKLPGIDSDRENAVRFRGTVYSYYTAHSVV